MTKPSTKEPAYILVNGQLVKLPADVKKGDVVEKVPLPLCWAITAYTDKRVVEARIDELEQLEETDGYPFYSDKLQDYIEKCLQELRGDTEGDK